LLCELLQQASLSRVPIARLAMQCGFSDAAHAARTFRNFYGTTPREYRGTPADDMPPITPLS